MAPTCLEQFVWFVDFLSINRQAKRLGISHGSVYYLPKPVSERDLDLLRRVDELHLKHPFMGTRQLRDQLNTQGIQVGRKHVNTLMRRMGIEAVYSKPNTSKKTPSHEIYSYLLRGMTIHRANQVSHLHPAGQRIRVINGSRRLGDCLARSSLG